MYRDKYGIAAIVRVRPHPQVEQRFPVGTDLMEIQQWQSQSRADLLGEPSPDVSRGTLAADVKRYLKEIAHLASLPNARSELKAWVQLYGSRVRKQLKKQDVIKARQIWLRDRYAPKTINHRVDRLKALCRALDGRRARTPCDEVTDLTVPDPQPRLVDPARFRIVARKLIAARDLETLARFLVLSSTGRRPSELGRADTPDVSLRRRVWYVRTGKGGNPTALDLNDDMLAAWRFFIAVRAWGAFDGSAYAKKLYAAGWPQYWNDDTKRRRNILRPYCARHSVAITLGELGAEWEDMRDWLGHKNLTTTKIYSGVIRRRLKQTSQSLEGRLGWATLELPARRKSAKARPNT